MPLQIQGNNGVVGDVDGTTWRALKTTLRPIEHGALGQYVVDVITGGYTTLAAGTALFSARWTDATRFAVIQYAEVSVLTTTAFTAGQQSDRSLRVVRAMTSSDTGGTAVALTGNNQKMRTNMGSSLFGDMRFHSTGLVKVAGTEDALDIGLAESFAPAAGVGFFIDRHTMLDVKDGANHPLVLAQNEGVRILIPTLMGAGGVQKTRVKLVWAEVSAY